MKVLSTENPEVVFVYLLLFFLFFFSSFLLFVCLCVCFSFCFCFFPSFPFSLPRKLKSGADQHITLRASSFNIFFLLPFLSFVYYSFCHPGSFDFISSHVLFKDQVIDTRIGQCIIFLLVIWSLMFRSHVTVAFEPAL